MSKSTYYTEARLEDALGNQTLQQFRGGPFVEPLDALGSIPGPAGALQYPPQGPFSSPVSLDLKDNSPEGKKQQQGDSDGGSMTVVWLLIGGVVLFYLLKPR